MGTELIEHANTKFLVSIHRPVHEPSVGSGQDHDAECDAIPGEYGEIMSADIAE